MNEKGRYLNHPSPDLRPSGTLSPSDGEREGVRGPVHGKPPFVLRMHWDHESDWHPSPCPLPARRGEGGRRPGEGRFMGSAHGFPTAHRSHEHPHPTRPSGTPLPRGAPWEGRGDGVRGIRLVTSAATVEKIHCFLATKVSRCHHQTILSSSSPRRNKSRADCGAWAMSSKTFLRFSGKVAAVSKYQLRSGCLNGVSVVFRTFKPAPSQSRLQPRGVRKQ